MIKPACRYLLLSLLCTNGINTLAADEKNLSLGKATFDKWCAICHGNSIAKPATAIISIRTGSADSAALANRTDLHPIAIKTFVRNGFNWLPSFRKTEISDPELNAIISYLTRTRKPAGKENE